MSKLSSNLYEAVRDGNTKLVLSHINSGTDVNEKSSKSSWTLLHWAAYDGNSQIAEILIRNGANVNENNNKYFFTPLHIVKNAKTARILLNANADVHLEDKHNSTPLLNIITVPTPDNPTENIVDLTKVLLAGGANPNVKNKDGFSPLHQVISYEILELLPLLIKAGADLTYAHREYSTPLHHAVLRGLDSTVKLLLDCGAAVNSQANKEKYTPLHMSVLYDYPKITNLLLDHGADSNKRDNFGKLPFDYSK